jgi:hypothetical protein
MAAAKAILSEIGNCARHSEYFFFTSHFHMEYILLTSSIWIAKDTIIAKEVAATIFEDEDVKVALKFMGSSHKVAVDKFLELLMLMNQHMYSQDVQLLEGMNKLAFDSLIWHRITEAVAKWIQYHHMRKQGIVQEYNPTNFFDTRNCRHHPPPVTHDNKEIMARRMKVADALKMISSQPCPATTLQTFKWTDVARRMMNIISPSSLHHTKESNVADS